MSENNRLNRLRAWLLGLAVVVVVFGGAAPILVTTWLEDRVQEAEFDITCSSARSNIEQLTVLAQIARELGLPTSIEIPSLPEECM